MANKADEINTMFAMGQGAHICWGSWQIRDWQRQNPDIQLGYLPWPPKRRGDKSSVIGVTYYSLAMNSQSENKEAARKVYRFVASPEFGSLYARMAKGISPIKGTKIPADVPLMPEIQKYLENNTATYNFFEGSPMHAQSPDIMELIADNMDALFVDQIDPQQFAQNVQDGLSTWYKPFQQ